VATKDVTVSEEIAPSSDAATDPTTSHVPTAGEQTSPSADAPSAAQYEEARSVQVARAIAQTVSNAIDAVTPPFSVRGKVYRGRIDPEEMKNVILGRRVVNGQNTPVPPQWRITVNPRPESRVIAARTMTQRRWYRTKPMPLTVTSSAHNIVTFAGVGPLGTGIVIAAGNVVGSYQVTPEAAASLNVLATEVSAAYEALGMTASAADASVVAAGPIAARIVRTGDISHEGLRVERRFQVTVYSPYPDGGDPATGSGIRAALTQVILLAVAAVDTPKLYLPDGSSAWVKYVSDEPVDKPIPDFDVYEQHVFVSAEYGIPRRVPGAYVEAIAATVGSTGTDATRTVPTVISEPVAPYGAGAQP
jgi:hypothetical protein